jgi:hypothetical protein
MSKSHASNKKAAALADQPPSIYEFEGRKYYLSWDNRHIIVNNDTDTADRIAAHLNTTVKHATMKHAENSTMSIVRMP